MGIGVKDPGFLAARNASASATKAPEMDAVLVPPSAWTTSQSVQMVRSPSLGRSITARSERPMSRWISCVRPDTFPFAASRGIRSFEERGSMLYSAVTQPVPVPFRNGGTLSSTVAAQITLVSPTSMSTEPSACFKNRGVITTRRGSSICRPSTRFILVFGALRRRPQVRGRAPVGNGEVQVTGDRLDLQSFDKNPHRLDRRKVGDERLAQAEDRQLLRRGAARMVRHQLLGKIEVGDSLRGDEELSKGNRSRDGAGPAQEEPDDLFRLLL